jgi:DNA (cytosine-5)-methyltransferase 1
MIRREPHRPDATDTLSRALTVLLPTPTAEAAKHGATPDLTANGFGSNLWDLPHLLPTPTPFTNSNSETPEEWLLRRKDVIERTGTHHGLPLAVAAASVSAGKPISQKDPMSSLDDWSDETESVTAEVNWGKYGAAIDRWARILGRPSPDPTIPNAAGRPRLSPSFVEWMMGLPAGHVCGHGLRPAQELKMLGNGVCPQQAELALRMITAP